MPIVPGRQEGPGYDVGRQIANENAQRRALYERSVKDGTLRTPDRAAKILKYQAMGVGDEDLIDRNLDEIEKDPEINAPAFDADRFRRFSPRMAKWLAESPNHVAVITDSMESAADLERKFYRRDDPLRPLTMGEAEDWARRIAKRRREEPVITRLQEERATKGEQPISELDWRLLTKPEFWQEIPTGSDQAAIRARVDALREKADPMLKESEEQEYHRALSSILEQEWSIAGKEPIGAFEGEARKFQENPLYTLPFLGSLSEIDRNKAIYDAAVAVKDGTASEDQEDIVLAFGRANAAEERRGRSLMGKVVGGITTLALYALEFAFTGGTYTTTKGSVELLLRDSLKKVLKGRARGIVRETAGAVAGAAAQTAARSPLRLAAGAIRRMTPEFGVTRDEEDQLKLVLEDEGDGFVEALTKQAGVEFVETLSERMGFAIERPVSKAWAPLKAAMFSRWMKRGQGRTVADFFSRLKKATGWNGIIPELFEERVSGAGQAVIEGAGPVEAVKSQIPGVGLPMEDLLAEALAFSAPGAVGFVTSFRPPKVDPTVGQLAGKIAADMKANNVPPETAERFADVVSGGEAVYIPVDDFVEYFQDKQDERGVEMDPAKVAEDMGLSKEYAEAVLTGGDLPMSFGKYVRYLAADHGKAFEKVLRKSPLEQNEREQQEQEAEVKKLAEAKPDPVEEEAASIGKNIADQLRAAGQQDEAAEFYGKVYERAFATLAKRTGQSPQELFKTLGTLKVTRPEVKAPEGGVAGMPVPIPEGAGGARTFEQGARERYLEQLDENIEKAKRDLRASLYDLNSSAINYGVGLGRPASALTTSEVEEIITRAAESGIITREDRERIGPGARADELANELRRQVRLREDEGQNKDAESLQDAVGARFLARDKREEIESQILKRIMWSDVHEDYLRYLDEQSKAGLFPKPALNDANKAPSTWGDVSENPEFAEAAFRGLMEESRETGPEVFASLTFVKPGEVGISVSGDVSDFLALVQEWSGLREQQANAGQHFRSFDQPGKSEDEARGRIKFGAGTVDIELLKKADLSSFLHETGHFYLELLGTLATAPDANDAIKRDYEAILKWMGVTKKSEVGMDQHEQFARGFERYLMEGKAPSAELRSIFARFRAWLVAIYKHFTSLNVELTNDVRAVFDRLLATEEEIQALEIEQKLAPLIEDFTEAGFPKAEAEKYRNAIERAKESRRTALVTKLMADIQKRKSAVYQAEREDVREIVAKELNERREYIALANLQRGTQPDGTKLPEDQAALKLDLKAVREQYPKLADKLPEGVTSSEGGVHPDFAAEVFGFSSGDELLSVLSAMRPTEVELSDREIAIRKRLEKLTLERKALEDVKEPIAEEVREAGEDVGRPVLEKKLEEQFIDDERASTADMEDTLREIRQRGGVRPSQPTDLLPRNLKAKHGEGVKSDELAQEFYSIRGVIKDAYSDDLYDYLTKIQTAVNESKSKRAESAKKIEALKKRSTASLAALVDIIRRQTELRDLIRSIRKQERAVLKEQREAVIDRIADERMRELHPEMGSDPGNLYEEAVKALHTEDSAEAMQADLRALASQQFAAYKGITRRLAFSVPTVSSVRQQAEAAILRLSEKDINPHKYQKAEQRSGREALDRFQKGDYAGAFEAKARQLLNHELYRAAVAAKEKIETRVADLKRFGKKAVREKLGKAGGGYLEQIDGILERYDFRRSISGTAAEKRERLRDWIAARKAEGLPVSIPDYLLDESAKRHYKLVPYEELLGIFDSIDNIEHLAGLKGRLLKDKKRREIDEAYEEIKAHIAQMVKDGRMTTRQAERVVEQVGRVEGLFAMHRKLDNIMRQMDGWKDGGPFWELVSRVLSDAADSEAVANADATKALKEIFDAAYSAKDWLPKVGRMTKLEREPAIGKSLTMMERVMIALNWGNAGNRQRLMDGYGWNSIQVEAILSKLDERDWKFVQSVWDYFDTFRPESFALAKRVTGIEPERVEPVEVSTRFGTFKGGYFPAVYDTLADEQIEQLQMEESLAAAVRANAFMAQTKHGHRINRAENVNRKLKLDPGVIFQHVQQVIHDLTHFEAIQDVNRILGDKRVASLIKQYAGAPAYRELKLAILDIAAGSSTATSAAEQVFGWLRRGTVTATLGFKVMTALKQTLGITQSVVRVGAGWIARGLMKWATSARGQEGSVAWIYERSPFMKMRHQTQMRELSEVAAELDPRAPISKVMSYGMFMTVKMQAAVDIPTWIGAYEKAMAEAPKANSAEEAKEQEERAAALADQAVRDSQGGGQVKDMARIMRGGAFLKLWTTFMGYFVSRLNLARESIGRTNFKDPASVAKLAVDMLLLYWLPATLGVLIAEAARGSGGDDDDKLGKKLLRSIIAEPFNDIIGARELTGAIQGYDYQGPAGGRFFVAGTDLVQQALQGEADETFFRKLGETAGILSGLPASQLDATIRGFAAWDADHPLAPLVGPPSKR